MTTTAEAEAFVRGRFAQFFSAIEANYSEGGPLFLGDRPSAVDFQLLAAATTAKYLFGEALVSETMVGCAPPSKIMLRCF